MDNWTYKDTWFAAELLDIVIKIPAFILIQNSKKKGEVSVNVRAFIGAC